MRKLLALCLALLPASSMAEPLVIRGGIICDTLEDVENLIRQEPAPTCGRLTIAVPAEVTMLEPFTHNGVRFDMAQYDFLVPVPWGVQTQYGFWGQPERIEPAALEFDA